MADEKLSERTFRHLPIIYAGAHDTHAIKGDMADSTKLNIRGFRHDNLSLETISLPIINEIPKPCEGIFSRFCHFLLII